MSRNFLKYAFTVDRLTAQAGNKEAYAFLGTIYGVVMGLSPEDTMLSEGNPATSAVLYTEAAADIKVGDRVSYGGDTYIVRGVKTPQVIFAISYKRCVVERMAS